jgi:ABC-type glycerol-3-phosphate transport system substrate-binding protein
MRTGLPASLAVFLSLALFACQPAPGSGQTPTPRPSKTPKPAALTGNGSRLGVEKEALRGLTIQAWYPWFGVEASLFESQVREFNGSNEWGIVVEPTSQLNYTQLFETVTTSLPTPDRPDVVIAFPEHGLAWYASGRVVDLNQYINDELYGWTAADLQDFPPVFWAQDSSGEKRLGLPAQRSARFILYDVTWARGLGFDSAPSTADEFRAQACSAHQSMLADQVRQNDAQGGWLVDTDPMTAFSWLTAFGGGVLEENDYRFLTPKNIAALRFVKQLYDDGCAWTAQPGADLDADFAARTALFATGSLEDLADQSRAFATAANGDTWTVLSFPGGQQSGLAVYGSSYFVLKSTPEEQLAAWLFVRWMLSSENQAKWVETTGLFPVRTSSLDLLGAYRASHPQWAAALDLLPEAQIQPQLASWRKVRVMLGDGFDNMFRLNIPAGRVAEVLVQMEATSRDLSK